MDELTSAAFDFTDSKDYFAASPEEQKVAKQKGFDIAIGATDAYKEATPERQDAMFTEYNRYMDHKALNSQYNPILQKRAENQARIDESGFFANTVDIAKESIKNSLQATRFTDDAIPGATPDASFGKELSAYHTKNLEKVMTQPQKELAKDIATFNKRVAKDGVINDALAYGKLAWDLAGNIKAVVQTGAESSSSLAAGLTGAKVAGVGAAGLTAATGGAAAPLTPFITGLGMATGSMAEAIPHQFYSEMVENLEAEGLDVTEFNINKFVKDNPEKLLQAQKDAVTYSGVIGLVDAVTGHALTKIAALPQRAARTEAMNLVKQSIKQQGKGILEGYAKKSGKSVDELIEGAVNAKTAELLKARPATAKFKTRMGQYLGEVASEPISEAAGTAAIGNENTAENLIYETIGGIGAGPISTAVDVSAFGSKVATDKAGKTAKKILNPQSKSEKAAVQKIKDQRKVAKKQKTSDRSFGYRKEVAETSPEADLSPIASPQSEKYDPIKAMDILAKSDDPGKYDAAMELRAQTKADYANTVNRINEIEAKQAEGTLTEKEAAEHAELMKLEEEQYAVAVKVKEKSDAMHNKQEQAAAAVEATPVAEPETASNEEITENITKTFGSKNHAAAMTNEKIEKALQNPNLTPETKTGLKTMQEANVAVEKVAQAHDTSGKSMQDVQFDIENGSDDFKGINNYKRSIAYATRAGNTEKANQEVGALEKFANTHREKANVFQAVFDSERLGKPLSQENADAYAQMQKENPNLNIHKGSKRLVEIVNMEADALEKSVTSAKAFVDMAAANPESVQATSAPATGTKKEKTAPSIPTKEKSPGTAPTAPVTKQAEKTEKPVVSPERIAKGLVAAIQTAQNTGKTDWLKKQISSGYLNKDQIRAAEAVLAEVEKKQKPAKPKSESAALVTPPKTPASDLNSTWTALDSKRSREISKMVGNKKGAVEQAIKKHEQGKKLGKRQQQVIDALIATSEQATEEDSPSRGEASESAPATATENLQTVDAPSKAELAKDDFGMTAETYGEFEIRITNASGEIEFISYNEAMQNLKNEKNMFEELRNCLTS